MKRLNDEGYAMVLALGFITALSVLALVIVSVSISEKKVAQNEYTYSRAFYSADAGNESAVNWLRLQDSPPDILDAEKSVYVPASYESISTEQTYKHDIEYVLKKPRPGWGMDYKDFVYTIESTGGSVQGASNEQVVSAHRLYREGY